MPDNKGAPSRTKRRAISVSVQREVFTEAGYRCANPTCRFPMALEQHHIKWIEDGGGNDPSNLIVLCSNCHDMHTRGTIPQETIIHWKKILLSLNHAFDQDSMDLLLYLRQYGGGLITYSGDGLVRFARLMAAGLAKISGSRPLSPTNTLIYQHGVELTDRGRLLVEAWIAGDPELYQRAINHTLEE
jgi:hypothetical protein